MSISLQQNGITASLTELTYHQAEGFLDGNTWCAREERITGESDTELVDGPGILLSVPLPSKTLALQVIGDFSTHAIR